MAADRDLLFGLLALQIGMIQQTQLVAAFHAWTCNKSRSLADHLLDRGDLDADDRRAVEALVARHLKRHGGAVEQSLATVPASRAVRVSLAALGEPEIEATLARVARCKSGLATKDDDDDPDRTGGFSVGESTSDGQRFRILRPHARGGLGAVFVALDSEFNREVALKQIIEKHADDLVSRQRFIAEAEITGGLEHPGVVPVYGLGTYNDGRPYYAMQFIQGQGLDQVIVELARLSRRDVKAAGDDHAASGRPEAPTVVIETASETAAGPQIGTLEQVAQSLLTGRLGTEALSTATGTACTATGAAGTDRLESTANTGAEAQTMGWHLAEVPQATNASSLAPLPGGTAISSMESSGRRRPFFRSVALIGRQAAQGLSYAHSRGVVHRDIKPSNLLLDTAGVVWITDFGLAKADDDGLTQTGDILGTLRYMAPERFRGEGDVRADIYALGLTLYELLTLTPAFETNDRLRMIERVKSEEPTRPRLLDGRIPRDLETIVLKAIDKDPARRYATAEAMAEDLRRFLDDEPIQARRATLTERYARWARRHPGIAVLGAVLTAVLVLVTVGSLVVASRMATLASSERFAAAAERQARQEARRQAAAEATARGEAELARVAAEKARAAAQAETYRAMLSETEALRSGHQPGWRRDALENLARLSVMPAPRRDLIELRSQAVASLGEFDIVEVARFAGTRQWSTVTSLAFSPDSRSLAAVTHLGDLHRWSTATPGHQWQVINPAETQRNRWGYYVAFLRDGTLVRNASEHRIEFLDAGGQPSPRSPIERAEASVIRLVVDCTGQWIGIGWSDSRIDVHEAATGSLHRSFPGNAQVFELSPGGKALALAGLDAMVRVVSIDPDQPVTARLPERVMANRLAFSPDGAVLATTLDQSARLWDLATGQERASLRGHKAAIAGLAFSPDGEWVATTSADYTTRIWDVRTGQTLSVLPRYWFMAAVAFSPDGRYLATSTDVDGETTLYQLTGRHERRWLAGHASGTQAVAFRPGQSLLASGADDNALILWDPESAQRRRRTRAHESFVVVLAYSDDGSLLATGGGTTTDVRIWDAETGTLRRALTGHPGWIARGALAFDPAGRRLASGDEMGNLIVWDLATGAILRRENTGPSAVRSVAFVDGGRRLLAAEEHGSTSLLLYDLDVTASPRRLVLPNWWHRFVVDRRRNRAVVADSEGGLTVISIPDLVVLKRVEKAHPTFIWSLALNHDGTMLATADRDGRVIMREAETLEPLLRFPAWTGVVKDIAFDSTGRWLAFAGVDTDIGLWDLGRLHEGLAALGLARDQPPPRVATEAELASWGERSRPAVPTLTPGGASGADLHEARSLVSAGVAAFRQGRPDEAVATLRHASERLASMHHRLPGDPALLRLRGLCHGFLASSLRDLKRPAEALTENRAALAAYEALRGPDAETLYNMACCCSTIASLDGAATPGDGEALRVRAVDLLRRAIVANPKWVLGGASNDHDLDPLRDRRDFRDLMADPLFPVNPFATTPPPTPSPAEALDHAIAAHPDDPRLRLVRGIARARRHDWKAALEDYRVVLPHNTSDTSLWMDVAALYVRVGDLEGYGRHVRAMIATFGPTTDPMTAERTAKACLLAPASPEDTLRLAALADRAVAAGGNPELLVWFHLAQGLARYRLGKDAPAAEALRTVRDETRASENCRTTALAYLAMAESRLGDSDGAKRSLEEARTRQTMNTPDPELPPDWHDWLISEIALREAEALIGHQPPPPASPPAREH